MKPVVDVAGAIARRSTRIFFTNPALLIPSILFPLVFLIGFAGGLSSVGRVPGFEFRSGYTAFQFVFVFLQSAAFGGVFTGFGVARDFESGFARRLLLAAPNRPAVVLGYAVSGIVRFAFNSVLITVAALIGGLRIDGTASDFVGLVLLGLLVNLAATLFATGVALRTRTVQSGPVMQIPIFLILFLAPVYVPRPLLEGWIHTVSAFNPATAVLQAGRGFISGVHQTTSLAFVCGAALAALMALYALRGLRKAEAEGG
jgi:ABC-2 type transport system permease protein